MQKHYILMAQNRINLQEAYLSIPTNGLTMKEMEQFGIHGSTFGTELSKAVRFSTKKEAIEYYEDQLDKERLDHLKDFSVMSITIKKEKDLN